MMLQKIPGEAKLLEIPTKKNGENIKNETSKTTKLTPILITKRMAAISKLINQLAANNLQPFLKAAHILCPFKTT